MNPKKCLKDQSSSTEAFVSNDFCYVASMSVKEQFDDVDTRTNANFQDSSVANSINVKMNRQIDPLCRSSKMTFF